ncbi:siderophore-interacting protein [Aeromicrobium fastidiosum]|uniref:Siderophore-interacting protein n=1 Tax=Aeromicrobium fastidiosum TaxID=52699 RepID=A0A641AQ79_9ACTN|nr:siderophore-interacting protein [Aeromicrobium fastidiosum]KAA1378405.1 siderophore-interacting protein [Aeromicrobium fastidiosum]MBP2392637.1 NADPH-dependent ferric siderophore reductase [Aeromicrobium fastidiosum]
MSANRPVRLTVVRTEQLAPSMRRIVLGGDDFDVFAARVEALPQRYTDLYVKLVFLADGFDYPEPLDLDVVKQTMPQEAWPTLRTYTISGVDEQQRLVTIDFVVHGDEGVAGPWAAGAQPGDTIHLRGPNGGYAPDPAADWHLFVGDEAGLPAIAASIGALDDDATAVAFIEVDGPADELDLDGPAGLELHWLHRGDAAAGTTTLLDDAVRAMPWREGRVQAFVHGESALLKSVRPYVLRDRGVDRRDVSVSAYWRRGTTEEGFRAWKSQQTDAVIRPST